ncbi:hypothetical protein WA026_005299 [Henosepilachna vigintioctopunctata]|uniref:Uncharacterized protein n=1 Tax=Henosepilachna vigintioctopunctata TaxID=420089 RepID=A0AAW1UU42_9CUCU
MAPKLFVMYASPPCRAVMMLAKEIELELEIEEVERSRLRTPEMLELNPEHTAPILVDDDFVLWDSHAIMYYLRLHFESGLLYQRCTTAISPLFNGIGDISDDDKDKIVEAYGFIEKYLETYSWVADEEMTIADFSILSTVVSIELVIPVEEDRFPKLTEWIAKGKALKYFDECNSQGLDHLKELIEAASA